MKTVFFVPALWAISWTCTFAQSVPKDSLTYVGDQIPEFPGGVKGIHQFLTDSIRYPLEAQVQKISGKVFVAFVIDATGQVKDVHIAKGIGGGCDEEAVRVIKSMPRWKPAVQNGKNIPVRYSIPIIFLPPLSPKKP